jgi:trehalose 6-phosphate synthase/phosphatase
MDADYTTSAVPVTMDSIKPDPTPPPPPSLAELHDQVVRLEESHKAKGLALSGRIIHLCHHLPVEVIRVVPDHVELGVLSPPMMPEFKPEGASTSVESADARWKIVARTGHTAMVSGIKSLSDTHQQLIVAWTGDVLLQTQSQPTPVHTKNTTLPSLAISAAPEVAAPASSALNQDPDGSAHLKVFAGQFTDVEKAEVQNELDRFTEVEADKDQGGKLKYVPVFLPPEVSKGHYEGFCKKSEWFCVDLHLLAHADRYSTMAAIPLPLMAGLHRHGTFPRPPLLPLRDRQQVVR